MNIEGIEKALREGCRLHAFRSGGGLRVIRLEKDGVLKGYGEHPIVHDAIVHACEDFLAGGRPYKEVYGGTHPHYLTGVSTASDSLDGWLLKGNTFDAWREGDEVVFQLKGYAKTKRPEDIDEQLKTKSEVVWEQRGFTYRSVKSSLPNGEPCVSTEVVRLPEGATSHRDAWMYHIAKTAKSVNFWSAMEEAFKASEVEVSD